MRKRNREGKVREKEERKEMKREKKRELWDFYLCIMMVSERPLFFLQVLLTIIFIIFFVFLHPFISLSYLPPVNTFPNPYYLSHSPIFYSLLFPVVLFYFLSLSLLTYGFRLSFFSWLTAQNNYLMCLETIEEALSHVWKVFVYKTNMRGPLKFS